MLQVHFERYLSDRYELQVINKTNDTVMSGRLIPTNGQRETVDTVNGILRFISNKNDTDDFGLQWNKFKYAQLDSASGYYLNDTSTILTPRDSKLFTDRVSFTQL